MPETRRALEQPGKFVRGHRSGAAEVIFFPHLMRLNRTKVARVTSVLTLALFPEERELPVHVFRFVG